ncbi:MAG: transglycosylase domain-containing protein [Alphaproteobacteria bacterium]
MARKPSRGRSEPGFFASLRSQRASSGMRGERLSVASAEEDGRGVKGGWRTAGLRPREKAPAPEMWHQWRGKLGRSLKRHGRTQAQMRGSLWGRFFRWAVTLAIWAVVAVLAVVAYYSIDLPDVSSATALTRRPGVTLVGADGQTFASYGDLYYDVVPLKDMPAYLPKAVLATEDRRFYEHFGVDPFGILRALADDMRTGKLRQGGSTITQQLAKNLFLKPERTIKRKAQEVLLALWLEHKFTKEQILTIYLNRVYLGAGTYGVEAAARKYFAKSAREVSLFEAAVLAGLLKAPSKFNPSANPDLTAQRADQVLQNMVEAGFLSPEKAKTAATAREELKPASVAAWRGRYFADWAMDQVRDLLGFIDRDIVVKTTLDSRLQNLAEDTLQAALDKDGASLDISQGAIVVLGPDGEVKALVGGRDYRKSQFDRAVQALRQPGSAFKPFVYLAGLEQGFTPDSVFNDAPITIGNWHPDNYDGKYFGRVTLRQALAHSLNSVAAQLTERAGIAHVIEVAHRLGITSELRKDASIALGTSEVSLLELTAAYGAFAAGGKGMWPYGILEISDRDGHVLYRRAGSGPGQMMTPQQASEMLEMMSGVIASGTGKAASLGRPAAGKTGTTQDYRDAWFLGFTPDLVTGVWVGNDDGAVMKKVTGGRIPARIWHDFMTAALKDSPAHEFRKPATGVDSVLQSILGGGAAAGGKEADAAARLPELGAQPRTPGEPVMLPGGYYKVSQ